VRLLHNIAKALLKLMKNNIAMKTEFSVFNKLHKSNPQLNLKNHNVHRVLMNIFYSFFPDFTDKKIYVNVERCSHKAYFDYESIYVAFFHIIENTTKYIKHNTQLNIIIKDETTETHIIFDMISLKIDNSEINKIFDEGYSGIFAKKHEKQGSGIGLSRIKKIIELNNGQFLIQTSDDYSPDDYANNKFIIKLKKENYFDKSIL
jgi:signal transduction histidine kinase